MSSGYVKAKCPRFGVHKAWLVIGLFLFALTAVIFSCFTGGSKDDLPSSYPIGCLLGRVNVVDVLSQEQYRAKVSHSQTPYSMTGWPGLALCA